jgi:hypothetical protein
MNRARRLAGRSIRRRRRLGRFVDNFAAAAGITLHPWQRDFTIALLETHRRTR